MLSRQQILNELNTIIQAHPEWGNGNSLTEDSNFVLEGFDSLDKVEFFMEVEKHFHITISDVQAEKIETVKKLINTISSLISA